MSTYYKGLAREAITIAATRSLSGSFIDEHIAFLFMSCQLFEVRFLSIFAFFFSFVKEAELSHALTLSFHRAGP